MTPGGAAMVVTCAASSQRGSLTLMVNIAGTLALFAHPVLVAAVCASSSWPALLDQCYDIIHGEALTDLGDDEAHALERLYRPYGELLAARPGRDAWPRQQPLRHPLVERFAGRPGDGQHLVGGDVFA